jgi:chaperonin GroEL (HSP60 family)
MSFLRVYHEWKKSEDFAKKTFAKACKELWGFLLKDQYPVFSELDLNQPWKGYDLKQGKVRDFREDPMISDSWRGFLETIELACSVCSQILLVDKVILK